MSQRIAIILFNLGGPDGPEAVGPFLKNLFSDPAIIRLPNPFRALIARMIAKRRTPVAQKIYAEMGGGSPILPNTEAQARALEEVLNAPADNQFKCFIAMRYWKPFAAELAARLKAYRPHHVVLLPLYPQFSSTTTASSVKEYWDKIRFIDELYELENDPDRDGPWETYLCCYPTEPGFIETVANLIRSRWLEASQHGRPRLLLSAHGLPEKIVAQGDPYQWQCEQTAAALIDRLRHPGAGRGPGTPAPITPVALDPGLRRNEVEASFTRGDDWQLCYQSRVGPMKWLGPATDTEVERAGAEGRPLVMAPIAFVSEHSETLVELDIEYRKLAEKHGVPFYARVPTASTSVPFIQGLASLVEQALINGENNGICSGAGGRICPRQFTDCPHKGAT